MSESSISDEERLSISAQTNHVSGGVDVDAQAVYIGGDVVGRDKITHTTRIRQFVMKPWAWLGGIAMLVIGLIIVAGLFNIGPLQTLFPQPTPTAFAPAKSDESLIIIADFEDRSGGKYQGIDPAQYIFEKLTAQAKKDNLDVRIERLRRTVDDNTVRATGDTYSATLVLWGWYDALTITPRIERIKTRIAYLSTEEGKHLSLTDPAQVEFSIIADLPGQSAYLVFFVLGLDAYSDASSTYDAALRYFNSAVETLSTNTAVTTNPAEAYFYRGNIHYSQGDLGQAVADFARSIQLRPDTAAAYSNRGVTYAKMSDDVRATTDLDQAIQFNPDDPIAYTNRGVLYGLRGDYDHAFTDFDYALRLKPDYANAYFNRGGVRFSKGDYDQALRDYDRVIQLKPDFPEGYNNRGNAYYEMRDYDRAILDYAAAINLRSDYTTAYYNRGNAYYSSGNYDLALADFERAIQLRPNATDVYISRGNVYFKKGNYELAIADCNQALQLSPDNAVAYFNRGNAHLSMTEYGLAITDYDTAIRLKPSLVPAYYNRGIAHESQNEKQAAIADFTKVMELSTDLELRQQAQDRIDFLSTH